MGNVKIEDLMVSQVMTGQKHQTVSHVKEVMTKHGIHALPISDSDGHLMGIVTPSDLLDVNSESTPVSKVMTENVFTVSRYDGPHIAARIMRNNQCRHVVVTHEKKIVGVLSSYDLLKLVEEHRFVMKNAPG